MAETDRRYRKSETQIQNALIYFLNKGELADFTFEEIIDKADINRSTFYLHYRNLNDVLSAIEDNFVVCFTGLYSKNFVNISDFVLTLNVIVFSNDTLAGAVLKNPSHRLDEKLFDLVSDFFRIKEAPRNRKSNEDSRLLGMTLVTSVRSLYTNYYKTNKRLNVETLTDDLVSLISSDLFKKII